MFAAAPLVGALCPVINAATAGGSLDGVLPAGAGRRLSDGFSEIATGAHNRIGGMLDSLRGRGLGVELTESGCEKALFSSGRPAPSRFGLGGIEDSLSKVAGMARQGLAGGL
jgi:hypothetical protein